MSPTPPIISHPRPIPILPIFPYRRRPLPKAPDQKLDRPLHHGRREAVPDPRKHLVPHVDPQLPERARERLRVGVWHQGVRPAAQQQQLLASPDVPVDEGPQPGALLLRGEGQGRGWERCFAEEDGLGVVGGAGPEEAGGEVLASQDVAAVVAAGQVRQLGAVAHQAYIVAIT